MSDSPHIIQRLLWDLECSSEKEYQLICQHIQEQFQGRIGELLEKLLDDYFPSDQHIRVDQLILDLGSFDISDLEDILEDRFQRHLTEALLELINHQKGVLQQSELSEYTWHAFEYFFLKGYAPWWIPLDEKANLTHSYRSLTQLFPQLVIDFFRKEGHKETVQKRLIYQLGEESVRTTIRLLEPSDAPYIEGYASDLLTFHRHQPVVRRSDNAMASLIWEIIIAYLMANRGSVFNTFSFVRSNLQQLAARYNINYVALLKTMHQQLPSLIPSVNLMTNLAFMVDHLFKEAALQVPGPSSTKDSKLNVEQWLENLFTSRTPEKKLKYLVAVDQNPFIKSYFQQHLLQPNFRKQFIYLFGDYQWEKVMETLTGTNARSSNRIYKDFHLILTSMAGELGGAEAINYYLKDAWLYALAVGDIDLKSLPLRLRKLLGIVQNFLPMSGEMFLENFSKKVAIHKKDLSLRKEWTKAVDLFSDHYDPSSPKTAIEEIRHLIFYEMNMPETAGRLSVLIHKLPASSRAPFLKVLKEVLESGQERQFRLLLQDDTFYAFVQVIQAGQRDFIKNSIKAFQHIHDHQALIPDSKQEVSLSLKEAILKTLLTDRGSVFNRKSFIRDSLHLFARRYNIPLEALLAYMLQLQNTLAEYIPELNPILLDLQNEIAPNDLIDPHLQPDITQEQSLSYNLIRFQQYLSWGTHAEKVYKFQAEDVLKELLQFRAQRLTELLYQYPDKELLLERLEPFSAETRRDVAKLLVPKQGAFLDKLWEEWTSLHRYIPVDQDTNVLTLVPQAMLEYIFILRKKYFVKRTFARNIVYYLAKNNNITKTYLERVVGQAAHSLSLPNYSTIYKPATVTSPSPPSFKRFKRFMSKGDLHILQIEAPKELTPYVLTLIELSERKMTNVFRRLTDPGFSARILNLYLEESTKLRLMEVLSPLQSPETSGWVEFVEEIHMKYLKEIFWQSILANTMNNKQEPPPIQSIIAVTIEEMIAAEGLNPEVIFKSLDKLQESAGSKKRAAWIETIKKDLEEKLEQETNTSNTDAAISGEDFSETLEDTEGISIENAGLVLLWPYWKLLFERMGLIAEDHFVSLKSQQRAVHILQFLVTGETQTPEPLLTFNKWICNLPFEVPIPSEIDLAVEDKELLEGLLLSVNQRWKPLENSGIDALRQTFLQRQGILRLKAEKPQLTVHRKGGVDALLGSLPWSFGVVNLPWKSNPLYVEW